MPKLLKAYRSDGSTRGIWQDATANDFRQAGIIPERASRVEVIREGPNRSKFGVDFTLLAELTGDPKLMVCLTRAYESYSEAVSAEVAWIEQNWILK
jgi:hypothetical protein